MTLEWVSDNVLRWMCLFFLLWYAYSLVFNKGIPNIRTAPAIRRKIIELLKREVGGYQGPHPFTIVDMGSGNGLITREIARAIPEAHIIGLEISKPALIWSNMLKKMAGLNNLEYIDHDFFAYDLGRANAVIMYLTIYQMETMGKKLHAELKMGTLVTSNRFPLGDGWEPEEAIQIDTLYLHQKKLNVYRQK